jgi:hypothetical protein
MSVAKGTHFLKTQNQDIKQHLGGWWGGGFAEYNMFDQQWN